MSFLRKAGKSSSETNPVSGVSVQASYDDSIDDKTLFVIDTSGNKNALLGLLVSTTLTTATQDYVPIARQANLIYLNTIPFGKDKTFLIPSAVTKTEE